MTAARQIETTFRKQRGRILAALISRLGDFALAEDALVNALEHWEIEGVPRNSARVPVCSTIWAPSQLNWKR